jgi:hypothetical protein
MPSPPRAPARGAGGAAWLEELLACIRDLAARTAVLLEEAAPFALQIADRRLALEVSVIHRLAARLTAGLAQRDPLSERVHLSGLESAPLALLAMGQTLVSRLIHRPAVKPDSGHRP